MNQSDLIPDNPMIANRPGNKEWKGVKAWLDEAVDKTTTPKQQGEIDAAELIAAETKGEPLHYYRAGVMRYRMAKKRSLQHLENLENGGPEHLDVAALKKRLEANRK